MKTMKNLLKLFLIWISSVLALCISVAFYSQGDHQILKNFFPSILLFMFYSIIFSFPAFIFFSLGSILVLRTQLETWKKKCLIILINYADIAGTGIIFLLLISNKSTDMSGSKIASDLLVQLASFYPAWVLVAISTIAILLVPFNNQISHTK